MNKIWQTNLITIVFVFCALISANAITCAKCQATGMTSLTMLCPDCGSNLHTQQDFSQVNAASSLLLRMYYTGDRPHRIPPYGKVYINDEYVGNIYLKASEHDDLFEWSDGLGKDFSAYYETRIDDLSDGVLKVEIEMRFKRFFNLARSFKRVSFPYVTFKSGKETVLEHKFNAAATFSEYNPPEPEQLPIVSDIRIRGASGTVSLTLPIFD